MRRVGPDDKRMHLSMIQDIIARMGSNSFYLKGWAVGAMIAVFAFAGKSETKCAILVSLVPVVAFWLLDAYYLCLERRYRALYEVVRKNKDANFCYCLNPNSVKINISNASSISYLSSVISKTVMPFYLACVGTSIGLYLINT